MIQLTTNSSEFEDILIFIGGNRVSTWTMPKRMYDINLIIM